VVVVGGTDWTLVMGRFDDGGVRLLMGLWEFNGMPGATAYAGLFEVGSLKKGGARTKEKKRVLFALEATGVFALGGLVKDKLIAEKEKIEGIELALRKLEGVVDVIYDYLIFIWRISKSFTLTL
ncbi:hypothetical protein SESBI_51318, partial [Sesbania bispinosa]